MINLEHKLTVDDLIVEYMMFKVKNGYDAKFSTSEFISFLRFFESKMPVEDVIYEGEELFKRFFIRKSESDWVENSEKNVKPHMDMIYNEKENDYIISANYRFSDYDKSVINTFFMDNGMSKYDDYKGTAYAIRNIIGDYLSNEPKRKIDDLVQLDEEELMTGKYISSKIIKLIWRSYVDKNIKQKMWSLQYLFEVDAIEYFSSIKSEIINLYKVLAKRVAVLYHEDKNLKISSYTNKYLARANYEFLIQGYEKLMATTFGAYKKAIEIDLSTLSFKESHEIGGVYELGEEADFITPTTSINSRKLRSLVKILEK